MIRLAATAPRLLAVLVLVTGAARPSDWPQLRGPARSGVVDTEREGGREGKRDGAAIPVPHRFETAWKRPLGAGYSGIVVVGDIGLTMASDRGRDVVVAFDAARGETRWVYDIAETYRGHHGSDDGPLSTPTVAGPLVYGLGPRGHFFALRLADGSPIWQRQLTAPAPEYGFATAPLLLDDIVVVMTGAPDGGAVTAFDRQTGMPRWSAGDDAVAYESPILVELAGRRQIVAAGQRLLFGIDPADGAVLWQQKHALSLQPGLGLAQPVDLGAGRILIASFDGAAAYRVTQGETGAFAVEALWQSTEFKRAYAVPVAVGGYVYGFNGRFLTCLDAADGRAVWKSRPPGARNLSLVDGQLVMVANDGHLVAVVASPAGYRETARTPVLTSGSQTAPSFADGHFFVRSGSEMARLRLVASAALPGVGLPAVSLAGDSVAVPPAADGERLLVGKLAPLAALLRRHDDPKTAVDRFLADQRDFPLITSDGRVHFVFRGAAEDVALKGNVLGFDAFDERDRPLARVPGTDLFVATLALDPAGHYEYRFDVDYGNAVPDPRNPHRVRSLFGEVSELRMPAWRVPPYLALPTGLRGTVERLPFESRIRGDSRTLAVYLPAGYPASQRHYPVLVVNNGMLALEEGRMDRALDHLIGDTVEPLIAVFIPRQRAELGGPATGDFARMLAEELLPWLEARYRLRTGSEDRAITGVGSGGFAAAYAAFDGTGAFGKLAAQSLYMPTPQIGEALLAAIARADAHRRDIYLEWSRNDLVSERLGIDARADNERLLSALEAAGHRLTTNLVVGAPGWGSWRAQTDVLLETLFPASADDP